MFDLSAYSQDDLEETIHFLARLWGSRDDFEFPKVLDDLFGKIGSLLDDIGQRQAERRGTDGD